MATHVEISKVIRSIKESSPLNVSYFGLAVIAILVFALIALVFSFALPHVTAQKVDNRALQAWSSRYEGLARDYGKINASNTAYTTRLQGLADASVTRTHRINAAWTARLQGQANAEVACNHRTNTAWTARWQGLADWYAQER